MPPKPKPERKKSKPRDLIFAVLLGVFAFMMTDCLIQTRSLGIEFSVGAVGMISSAVWYLRPVLRVKSLYSALCVALFAVGSVSMIFSADSAVKALTLLCLMILYVCLLTETMNLRAWAAGSFRSIGDFFYTGFGASFGKIGDGVYALFHREKEASKKNSTALRVLLGILIAIPVMVILGALLCRADEAFNGMLRDISLGSLPKELNSLVFAVFLFILLFSQLFCVRFIKREARSESEKGFDPIILTAFLTAVSALYIAYLFSQLSYFFSGFGGFLPADFTYAEYARRGFFELTAVSVINIMIVLLSSSFSKKRGKQLFLPVRLNLLFLCVFSLILTATEITKMKMYTDAYGLTRLRILTTLFMIFLAIVFSALIISIFARRFPYMKIAVISAAVLAISVNFLSVDRTVAEYNTRAYQNGALKEVDVYTITELGDAAVPYLLELAQCGNEKYEKPARENLEYRLQVLHGYEDIMLYTSDEDEYFSYKEYNGKLVPYDFRGFNTVSYRARQLLLENEKLFSDTKQKESI